MLLIFESSHFAYRLSLKNKRPTGSQNVYEDTGHQASPVRMTGREYSDLHTRYDSHKYQDLQSVSQPENAFSVACFSNSTYKQNVKIQISITYIIFYVTCYEQYDLNVNCICSGVM
jgi:hypothetical protein